MSLLCAIANISTQDQLPRDRLGDDPGHPLAQNLSVMQFES